MSTRGYLGLRKNKELKGHYNHFDSYPSGLGHDVFDALNRIKKEDRLKVLNDTFDYIQLVIEGDEPTKEQIEVCKKAGVCDFNVSSKSDKDWYCLLRNTQGDLDLYVNKTIPYMIDGNAFLDDPLFCEWAYIINLDTGKLEVYEGGNKNKRGEFDLLDLNFEDLSNIDNYY